MKPRVSIITLTYKNYERLYDTIRSVLAQDYPNMEYIIADDGSGDFPKDEVERFIIMHNKRKIDYKIIVNEENLGIVKNFNNAIRLSDGDFVFPLAGNDIFLSEHVVTKITNVFIRTKCKMVITSRLKYVNHRADCIYPHILDRKKIKKLDSRYKKYRALMLTEHYGMFIGCNVYYDKKTLEKHGLCDENYRLLEDLPNLEKFLWYEDVELKPEIISICYDGDTGVTLKKNKSHLLLENDIIRFNSKNKMNHYNELDRKTRYHIDFGVERAKSNNLGRLILVCLKYLPRIISYMIYCFREKIIRFGDNNYIKKINKYSRYISNDNQNWRESTNDYAK